MIFTLAALITAIATAHAQPIQVQFPQVPVQQFQQAQLAPFITIGSGGDRGTHPGRSAERFF